MRMLRIAVLAALLLAACGGSSGATTTGADGEATTTVADDTGGDTGDTVDIGDIPQECLDAMGDLLRAIEPAVEGVDFENATSNDLAALGTELEPAMATYDETIAGSDCEELDVDATDEETFDYMIDFAESEAPGTVAYLTWIRDFAAGSEGEGSAATGDCEQDIALLMEFVNRDGTMSDLTMAELTTVGEIMGSISAVCSTERNQELFSDPAMADFLDAEG